MMADTICNTCVRVREGLCDGEKELTACQYYKGMTNFDKYFRFTSAEKLAELLTDTYDDENIFFCPVRYHRHRCRPMDCKVCLLDWLKEEVAE